MSKREFIKDGGILLATYVITILNNGMMYEKVIDTARTENILFHCIKDKVREYVVKLEFKNNSWYFSEGNELKLPVNTDGLDNNNIKIYENIDLINEAGNSIASLLVLPFNIQTINMRKYSITNCKNITIGRISDNEICYSINKNISRKHATIHIDDNNQAFVHDLSSGFGVYVNNINVTSCKLMVGDVISIAGLKVTYLGDFIALNILESHCKCKLEPYKLVLNTLRKDVENNYTRSPRILKSIEKGDFEIDPPPTLNRAKRMPIIFTMGPSLTMGIAAFVSLGLTFANASSGGSRNSIMVSGVTGITTLISAVLWSVAMDWYQKRTEKKEEDFRRDKYIKYLKAQDEFLNEKASRNIRVLNNDYYPSPERIIAFLHDEGLKRRIWEKTSSDTDFMHVRLGKGSLPFDIKVITQKERFTLVEDPMIDELTKVVDKYKTLKDVPITFSLLEVKTIGFIGKRSELLNTASSVALQLAALHSYDELKMVFIYNEAEAKHFQWVRKIPHTWSNERDVRYIGTSTDEVHSIFSSLDEVLKEREKSDIVKDRSVKIPQYVVFVFDEALIENEALSRYLYDSNNKVGVSTLFVYGDVDKLPIDCKALVQSDGTKSGIYIKNNNENIHTEFIPDSINGEQLEAFSYYVSRLKVKNNNINSGMAEKLSFLDIYKVGNVKALHIKNRWDNSLPEKSLAAPIGVKKGGQLFSLDVHESYHGPHGLVAGMTGSGKSEFLQSYILSLAVNFHPNDVAFILIDFKGGGMANCFDILPHLAGKITNLSGNQLRRSLISIRAELQKRQKLFSKYNVNHIDKYHRLYKEGKEKMPPMPHLIIISDEFAQLKSQQPEFMRELIDVAQIGRSLGIHMILATQKPAGVVDEQIWGNSRFRVCLKVLDQYDSKEMIRKSDAAAIKLPGRAYVQVGFDEIFEQVQSGYSGSEYISTNEYIDIEDKTVRHIDNCANVIHTTSGEIAGEITGQTQLEAVLEHIKKVSEENSIKPISLWLQPLASIIYLDDIEGFKECGFDKVKWRKNKEWLNPIIGYADLPEEQMQFPLRAQLGSKGHIAVVGGACTGKTTFLQTLIYSLAYTYSPEEVNIYVIDLGGRTLGCYSKLPHCGNVAYVDNEDEITSIINRLYNEIEERKKTFSAVNAGGIEAYITETGKTIPGIVLCIDNYSVFHERFYDLEDLLIEIARDGRTYGVYLVVTGTSKSSIGLRLSSYFKNFFALEMNDSYDYKEILGTNSDLKPESIVGRGVTVSGSPVEFQTALAINEDNEAVRINQLSKESSEMKLAWKGSCAPSFTCDKQEIVSSGENKETIITSTSSTDKREEIPIIDINENSLYVGIDTRKKIEQALRLKHVFSFFIGGQERYGKTNTLKSILSRVATYPQKEITIIDNYTEQLRSFSKEINADRYICTADGFGKFVEYLEQVVYERSQVYKDVSESLEDEDEIFGCMQMFTKQFIAIDDFQKFYEMITDEDLEKLEKLIKLMKGLNIYFITTANFNNLRELFSGQVLYKYLVETDKGIILRGNVDKQICISLNEMTAEDRGKSFSVGRGFLFDKEMYKEIEVPLYSEGD